jgi:hypothetical protein
VHLLQGTGAFAGVTSIETNVGSGDFFGAAKIDAWRTKVFATPVQKFAVWAAFGLTKLFILRV